MASTSRIRGTLRSNTSSSVRSVAARIGRAAFLLPAGSSVPESGCPPSMTNFSIVREGAGIGFVRSRPSPLLRRRGVSGPKRVAEAM